MKLIDNSGRAIDTRILHLDSAYRAEVWRDGIRVWRCELSHYAMRQSTVRSQAYRLACSIARMYAAN